jgi:Domain of unknown function (DUF4365)
MSEDSLLSDYDVESALSIAYVQAIAAQAGYTCGEPPGPDRDSVDIQIAASGAMRPKLDLQLKASTCLKRHGDEFSYTLKLKNYNDLRIASQTPRLLVILDLPHEPAEWLNVSVDELIIRRAAYWRSLYGSPETSNRTSIMISIPTRNIFDVNALKNLMEHPRKGRIT